jgi:hypothetical protein
MKRKESPVRYIKMKRKKSTNRKRGPPAPASNESKIIKCDECGIHIDSDKIEKHKRSLIHKRNVNKIKSDKRKEVQTRDNNDLIKKKKCKVCDLKVDDLPLHIQSDEHKEAVLKKWAEKEGIYNYESKTLPELLQLQELFLTRQKDYSLFNLSKLQDKARSLKIDRYRRKNREQLIHLIKKVNSNPSNLRLRNLKYIQEQARELRLPNYRNMRKQDLIREIYRRKKLEYCEVCDKTYRSSTKFSHNNTVEHKKNIGVSEALAPYEIINESENGNIVDWQFNNPYDLKLDPFLDLTVRQPLIKATNNFMTNHRSCKQYLTLQCTYQRQVIDSPIPEETKMYYNTSQQQLLSATNMDDHYNEQFNELIVKEQNRMLNEGSGWSLKSVDYLIAHNTAFVPFRGSSYIELPGPIKKKKACVNIKNNDEFCFQYALNSALHPVEKDPQRPSKYKDCPPFNDDGLTYPMQITDIPQFEKQNPGIAIYIHSYDIEQGKYTIYPLYRSIRCKEILENSDIKLIDLLYFRNLEGNGHYCWIKDISRLYSSQISLHEQKKFFCRVCRVYFANSSEAITTHEEQCNGKEQTPILPKPGTTVTFKNFNHKVPHPWVIVADCEALIQPIDTTAPNPEKSYTNRIQRHQAYSTCAHLLQQKAENQIKEDEFLYRGHNPEKALVSYLFRIAEQAKTIRDSPVDMILSDEDKKSFNESGQCYLCEEAFIKNNPKVRDHDHLTGKYRGAAHQDCNLQLRVPNFIPVLFHNLSRYDLHLIVRALAVDDKEIKVIANNEEGYISLTKITNGLELRFIDSFRFMGTSLQKLVESMNDHQFKQLKRQLQSSRIFQGFGMKSTKEELFYELRKKGIYPYEYTDSMEKFETSNMPSRSNFYSRKDDKHIKQEDYNQFKKVWRMIGNVTLGKYSDLYLWTDVILLADIIQNFRETCLKTYGLDPMYYYTAPGLAWDAMLKLTKIELELISDYEMLQMVKEGIRGGISQCSHRYVKANNPIMKVKKYNPNKKETYLLYIDANNLYGWAMSQYLPYSGFKFIDADKFSSEEIISKIQSHPHNHNKGYILTVDLDYPIELHDDHSDLPLAPIHKNNKLMCTLENKERYTLHYRTLKRYLDLGLKVTKVHKILEFDQKDWMKEYIDLNTSMRAKATTEFEKDFYKLMNNAVYGKTMENVEKRRDIRLKTEAVAMKLARKPNFISRTIFDKNLIAVHMKKTCTKYNKPMYVGMVILEMSKLHMYDFHYNVIKKKIPNVKLCYMDTDSFIYATSINVYDFIAKNKSLFDTSNYKTDHPLYSKENSKVIGKFKDELGGMIMEEFCGLRAKLYAFDFYNEQLDKQTNQEIGYEERKRAKGIKKSVIDRKITMNHYKKCNFKGTEEYHKMTSFRSYKHEIYTIEQNKKSLCPKDDKRYIAPDNITTYPWGHCMIEEMERWKTLPMISCS